MRYLEQNIWQYAHLDDDERGLLHKRVKRFVDHKRFEGCGGFEITEEVRVTIAGLASLITLGFPAFEWTPVHAILVYPDKFRDEERGILDGEADQFGTVVLSWRLVVEEGRSPKRRANLVIHEFAHVLDGMAGWPDGRPPMFDRGLGDRWTETFSAEFRRHEAITLRDSVTVLGSYAATDLAEFFSEASACFFQRPADLHTERPELFGLLREWYRQDPLRWVSEEPSESVVDAGDEEDDDWEDYVEGNLAAYDALLARDPNAVDERWGRAMFYYDLGRLDEAVADLNEVVRLRPDDPVALRDRALARAENQDPERALDDLTRSLELHPGWVQALLDRAEVHEDLGDATAALEDLNDALEADPESDEAAARLGEFHADADDPETALGYFEKASKLNPDDYGHWLAKGAMLSHLERYAESARVYEHALELRPGSDETHAYLAWVLNEDGRATEALPHLDRAIDLDPEYAEAYAIRASVHEALGNADAARADREQADRLSDDEAADDD